MRIIIIISIIIIIFSCKPKKERIVVMETVSESQKNISYKDSIYDLYLDNNAFNLYLYSQEYQENIDKQLAKDSSNAYLWQQKAMPLFKQGKYELGMIYVDKAVKYNRREWQEYRAFIKCIFAKTYKDAIADFTDCKKRYGNNYVMDHTYNFYIALSKIQLNKFKEAEEMLQKEIEHQTKIGKEDLIHHLDYFYFGIAKYEQKKYQEAIAIFDKALEIYPEFSEVLYYKGFCLLQLSKKVAGKELMRKALEYKKNGYTINEDNTLYERYPYQIRL